MKPIKLTMNFMPGKDSVFQRGVMETMTVEIIDGAAAFHFLRATNSRAFSKKQKADGFDSRYVERLQKTMCKYPDKTQKEILEHIQESLKNLGATGKGVSVKWPTK